MKERVGANWVWFKDALRWDAKNFPASLRLGRLDIKQQKLEEAIPLLQKAAALRPDAIDPQRLLGMLIAS